MVANIKHRRGFYQAACSLAHKFAIYISFKGLWMCRCPAGRHLVSECCTFMIRLSFPCSWKRDHTSEVIQSILKLQGIIIVQDEMLPTGHLHVWKENSSKNLKTWYFISFFPHHSEKTHEYVRKFGFFYIMYCFTQKRTKIFLSDFIITTHSAVIRSTLLWEHKVNASKIMFHLKFSHWLLNRYML